MGSGEIDSVGSGVTFGLSLYSSWNSSIVSGEIDSVSFGCLISPEHIDGTHNPADLGTKLLPAEATERYSRYVLDSAGRHSL